MFTTFQICFVVFYFRLINLRTLELRDNMLKDLPSSFVSLKNLECIDLGSNMFEEMVSFNFLS